MNRFISREGELVPAGEVFDAWTSGDLPRMERALSVPCHPIDRHFLLMGIVEQAYRLRGDERMHALCLRVGRQHAAEYPAIVPHLREDMGGQLPPQVPSFVKLIALLEDEGELDEAAAVCELALSFGLKDGTKGGYSRRLMRIQKAQTEIGDGPD